MTMDRRTFSLAGLGGLGLAAMGAAQPALAARKAKKAASPAVAPKKPGQSDVIVLGAGVSGLQAAWMLEQEGKSVTVIEARERVGGRIWTLLDQPGYPEMGFNSMAAGGP